MSRQYLSVLLIFMFANSFAQIGAKVQQSKIYGIWQNNQFGYQMVLMLNENGTGEFDGEQIRFSIAGNRLTIVQSDITNTYTFVHQNNSLTLSGGDLEKPITFGRLAANEEPVKNTSVTSTATQSKVTNGKSELIGTWTGNGETIEFKPNGMCNYLGQSYPYSADQTQITLTTPQGKAVFSYTISEDKITLMANGQRVVYSKGGATQTTGNNGRGNVATELVGKWCYVNVYSTQSGGSSTSRCITLFENGTYEYYGESSRSVNTSDYSGGVASQSSDRGTWWVQGDRIFYNSQTNGQGSYQLQKQNHPKNGDPMIVLDGETYVTFYNKAPWR